MYVKFNNAHWYEGPRGDTPRHAVPRTCYQVGDVVDLSAEYFETYLEPYGFAEVVAEPAAPADEGAGARTAELEAMKVEDLRTLAEEAGLLEKITGSGTAGRVVKADLIAALLAAPADGGAGDDGKKPDADDKPPE